VVAKTPVEQAQDIAERAVLIPVGAAIVASERVIGAVTDLVDSYSTPETAQKQLQTTLKTFERRGSKARTRLERQAKRTRTRVQRELRRRRSRTERLVKHNQKLIVREAKSARKDVVGRLDGVTTQLEQAVSTGQRLVARSERELARVA